MRRRGVAMAAAVGLALAACGGSDDGSTAGPTSVVATDPGTDGAPAATEPVDGAAAGDPTVPATDPVTTDPVPIPTDPATIPPPTAGLDSIPAIDPSPMTGTSDVATPSTDGTGPIGTDATAPSGPTTTESPAARFARRRGLVWESAVDESRVNTDLPRPRWEADGVTVEIDLVIVAPGTDPACVEVNERDGTSAPVCLIVQLRFDVADDFAVDDAHPQALVSIDAAITFDRVQLDSPVVARGYPGTRDRTLTEAFPGAASGTTIKIRSGSEVAGFAIHDYLVPPDLPLVDF